MNTIEETNKIPIVAIIGPTAVGKTEASLALARNLNAEIISVDSRQVYRYLNVGTDKISASIRAEIPHHLIDVVAPDEIFSAADFVTHAQIAIEKIRSSGRVPLLVGGTAFYYKALEGGFLTESLPKSEALRASLEQEIKDKGLRALHRRLEEIDPVSAQRVHPNDPVRTMRALEIYELTGRTATDWYKEGTKSPSRYQIHYIGLNLPREELYVRIVQRVKEQFASGYYDEVRWLLEKGYSPELPAMQGFGYRELVRYHLGEMTFEEALEGDIRATKIYARRQITWFKHFLPVTWYDLSKLSLCDIIPQMTEISLAHLKGMES